MLSFTAEYKSLVTLGHHLHFNESLNEENKTCIWLQLSTTPCCKSQGMFAICKQFVYRYKIKKNYMESTKSGHSFSQHFVIFISAEIYQYFLWPSRSFSVVALGGVFPHYSLQKSSGLEILGSISMNGKLEIFLHRFSVILNSGNCTDCSKSYISLSFKSFMIDLEVCFRLLYCWTIQLLFSFIFSTGCGTLAWRSRQMSAISAWNWTDLQNTIHRLLQTTCWKV